jgi:hypothetical protein
MTQKEHLFVLSIYAMQSAKYNLLIKILKNHGHLADDDLQAFRALVAEEGKEPQEWFVEAWKAYQATAASLGIVTGLENYVPPARRG